jgi:hypothetical protein
VQGNSSEPYKCFWSKNICEVSKFKFLLTVKKVKPRRSKVSLLKTKYSIEFWLVFTIIHAYL